MLLQCAGGPSAVFPGQCAAANQELCGGGLLLSVNLGSFSSLDEEDFLPWRTMVLDDSDD